MSDHESDTEEQQELDLSKVCLKAFSLSIRMRKVFIVDYLL